MAEIRSKILLNLTCLKKIHECLRLENKNNRSNNEILELLNETILRLFQEQDNLYNSLKDLSNDLSSKINA